MWVDTHCHLNFAPLYDLRQAIVARAIAERVSPIITVGTDITSSKIALDLAQEFENVFATVGIHPNDVLKLQNDWMAELEKLARHEKVIAIGEIGLDYYWNRSDDAVQKTIFGLQIQLAERLNLPMVIHNRRADADLLEILKQHRYYCGVLHCYSSDADFAVTMVRLGLHISFTGSITYGSKRLEKALVVVPSDRLMLETDAPWITPAPFKGQTNEPAYIPLIGEKVATILNQPVSAIAEKTTRNAREFFRIPG